MGRAEVSAASELEVSHGIMSDHASAALASADHHGVAMLVCGVDPGKSGGMAWLDHLGRVVAVEAAWEHATLRTVDPEWVAVALRRRVPVCCAIEAASAHPGEGVTSAYRYGVSWGVVCGAAAALRVRLAIVPPRVWQRAILGKETGATKERAAAWVAAHHPGVNVMPGRRRTPHSGLIDAICIAEWARQTILLPELARQT